MEESLATTLPAGYDDRKNQLTTLPEDIGQLLSLRRLEAQENQLNQLPTAIGMLSRLERLDLVRNRLSVLPVEIAQLTHLYYLNLGDNHLSGQRKYNVLPDYEILSGSEKERLCCKDAKREYTDQNFTGGIFISISIIGICYNDNIFCQ